LEQVKIFYTELGSFSLVNIENEMNDWLNKELPVVVDMSTSFRPAVPARELKPGEIRTMTDHGAFLVLVRFRSNN